jgi:hypothetical protein
MILLVGPGSLGTGQALVISGNDVRGPVCKSEKSFKAWNEKRKKDTLSNLIKGDVIKTFQHFPLHFRKGPCTTSNPKTKLHRAPVLFDKIEFTVIFGIEVA